MNSLLNFYHFLSDKFAMFVAFIVAVVGKLGYPGIIVMMARESSFIPFPSEVVIPPAGYLTVHGDMNIFLVILSGIIGSIAGASLNYMLALKFGRRFLEKYAKYLFLTGEKLEKMDCYFSKHGEITTLVGRMIPVVRQYISFPAGLARMNFVKFIVYTALGSSVWVIILAVIGRMVGDNIDMVKSHLHTVVLVMIPVIVILIIFYIVYQRRKAEVCEDK